MPDKQGGNIMTRTEENLRTAFAGESQANRKYLAFAAKAEKDGYPQVARLFRAVADAETVHAHSHLRAMGGIKDTRDNLEVALGGEHYEFENMYPPMVEDAKKDGDKRAEISFRYASEVEKVHAGLFRRALEGIDRPGEADYHVCQVCGNTVEGEPPGKCPICNSDRKMFRKVE
jgi:rubrerythrin